MNAWSLAFYGLLDRRLERVVEFYPSREVAQAALDEILRDEPSWSGSFEVVLVDFAGTEVVVERSVAANA